MTPIHEIMVEARNERERQRRMSRKKRKRKPDSLWVYLVERRWYKRGQYFALLPVRLSGGGWVWLRFWKCYRRKIKRH